MKKLVMLLAGLIFPVMMAEASTLDVVKIYHPVSLHGTDSAAEESGGEVFQAGVFSRPLALSGAFPEALVDAVARPFQMEGSESYKVKECNLMVLCGLAVSCELEDQKLRIELDVSKMKLPKEVEMNASLVVKLAVKAIQKTLWAHPMDDGDKLPCEIIITGVTKTNKGLAALGKKFTLGE